MKDTVVNLSNEQLDGALLSLLQKGLNYAVTPKATPIEDILTGVEKAIQSLPAEKAEEARQETVRILKNTKRPRDNLSKAERTALKNLKDNTNLTILPADKGNATVILNTTDYKQKISTMLQEPAYKKLKKRPYGGNRTENHTTTQEMPNHGRNKKTTGAIWLQTTKTIWVAQDTQRSTTPTHCE